MRLALLLCALALGALLATDQARAQDRALIAVGVVDGDTLVFVDTASVTPRRGSGEVDYVMVPPRGNETMFEILRLRIDCRTRRPTLVNGRAFTSITDHGEPIPQDELGALDWEADGLLMATVCGQGEAEAREAYPSLIAALAYARQQQARIAEHVRPPETYRLQRIGSSNETGVAYLDINSRQRSGDEVTFWTYAVFFEPVQPVEEGPAFQSVLVLLTADCALGQYVTDAVWIYAPDGELIGGGATSGAAEDVSEAGMRAAVEAACRSSSTSFAFTSLDAARADARRRR